MIKTSEALDMADALGGLNHGIIRLFGRCSRELAWGERVRRPHISPCSGHCHRVSHGRVVERGGTSDVRYWSACGSVGLKSSLVRSGRPRKTGARTQGLQLSNRCVWRILC
jgi:hypothetical protein